MNSCSSTPLRAIRSIAIAMTSTLAQVVSILIGGTSLTLSVARSPALAQTTGVHTPAAGSVERAAILDAMRSGDNPDRIFIRPLSQSREGLGLDNWRSNIRGWSTAS
jgi:hypothetical protein